MQAAARRFVIVSALLLGIATALGAWAAHGLERIIDPAAVDIFDTGVRYHFYHALGLLGVGLLIDRAGSSGLLVASAWLLIAGIAMFSGSLYVLAFGGFGWLGPVTPLGGICFILAWLTLALSLWRKPPPA